MNSSIQKIYSYFESDPNLKVLFVFNDLPLKDDLDKTTWKDGYRYVEFKGDWFTCKYLLDTEWKDDKVVLYFNSLSPLQSQAEKERFPLLDVLMANKVYSQGKDYMAFMLEHRLQSSMTTFVQKNIGLLQHSKVLTLLEPYYRDENINVDVATRGILSMFLSKNKVLPWDELLVNILLLGRSSEHDKQASFFKRLTGSQPILDALQKRFADIFGTAMDTNSEAKVEKIVQSLKYNAIVQNIALVDADNYADKKIVNSLALQQLNQLLEFALSQPAIATAFEELLNELGSTIRCDELVRWYGVNADFHYIPQDLCTIILRSLMQGDLSADPHNTRPRIEHLSANNYASSLTEVLNFILLVVQYYDKVASLPSSTRNAPSEYVLFYEEHFYQIDQLYRLALESYFKVSQDNDLFPDMKGVKNKLDFHYHKTANRFNLAWTGSLRTAGGFADLSLTRQWHFYDEKIRPIPVKVAVIVCDALRYEVAKQIVSELTKSKHIASLSAGIATLPTETKFCKPSLLPYQDLEMFEKDKQEMDMKVDGKTLVDLNMRSAHLQAYKDDAICVDFKTVAENDVAKNRDIFKHSLVYIFHNDIDESGHTSVARQIVGSCAQAIKDIASMIPRIHASYNVTEVYVTSDHGFLFNDIPFADNDKLPVPEEALERKSRYYLTTSKDDVHDVVKFPLSEVSGMRADDDVFVAVPEGTNRFFAPSGGYMFAHGGATLQEILIPIIESHSERTDKKEPVGVVIMTPSPQVRSSHLRLTLLQTEAVSASKKGREVIIALYHNNQPVSVPMRLRFFKEDADLENRKMDIRLTLNKDVNAKVVELRMYDVTDMNNPLERKEVKNNTLIEKDFE